MSTPTTQSLTGKVALITGGSKGIGRATALLLSQKGARVAINYSTDTPAANSLVHQLGGPERALAIQADASNVPSIQSLVSQTVAHYGRIDILIPNAGLLAMADLASTTEPAFDATFALNVKGPYFLAQAAAPYMPSGSHVIFVSTTQCHASTVTPAYLLYNASKGAIEQMVRVMSKDLARKGIRVNAVAPGPTATDLFLKGKSDQMIQSIGNLSPFGRLGAPEEVAEAMAFLAGDESRWINGQIIKVNGGMA